MGPGVTTDNRGSSRTLIQQLTACLCSSTTGRPVAYNDEVTGSSPVTPTTEPAGQSPRLPSPRGREAASFPLGPRWGRENSRSAPAGRPDRIQPLTQGQVRLRVQVAVAVQGEVHRGMAGPGRDLLGGSPQRQSTAPPPCAEGRECADRPTQPPGSPAARSAAGTASPAAPHPAARRTPAPPARQARPSARPRLRPRTGAIRLDRPASRSTRPQRSPAISPMRSPPKAPSKISAQYSGAMASASFQTSAGQRNRISLRSILGSGTRRHGVCGIMPASTAAAMTLLRSW